MTPMEKLVTAERARERVGVAMSELSKIVNRAEGDIELSKRLKSYMGMLNVLRSHRDDQVKNFEKLLWGEDA